MFFQKFVSLKIHDVFKVQGRIIEKFYRFITKYRGIVFKVQRRIIEKFYRFITKYRGITWYVSDRYEVIRTILVYVVLKTLGKYLA